jgi:hypothetical protein
MHKQYIFVCIPYVRAIRNSSKNHFPTCGELSPPEPEREMLTIYRVSALTKLIIMMLALMLSDFYFITFGAKF